MVSDYLHYQHLSLEPVTCQIWSEYYLLVSFKNLVGIISHLFIKAKKGPGPMAKPLLYVAPRDGLEPPTRWLTATRSTS